MKVCFVTASVSRNAGGLYEGVRRLAQCCAGSELSVVGVEDEHTAADLADWQPVPVQTSRVFGPERFSFAPGLKATLLQSRAEIAHLHGLWRYPSVAVSRWHRQSGRPYIVHPHGMLDSWAVRNSGWKKKIAGALFESATLRQAACLRALCRAEAESIRSFGCRNPICIIPNGADIPNRPFADPSWKQYVSSGVNTLLYLGRLHPKKGLMALLDAWAKPPQPSSGAGAPRGWALIIAGWDDGGHEAKLKRRAEELGLRWADVREGSGLQRTPVGAGGVLFVGPQFGAAKSESYHCADAFILPSLSEGLPMTILEAWSHGKVALMTPQCNLPEGFAAAAAIPIGTTAAEILTGLSRLFVMSSAEINEMGARGLKLVAEKFSWERVSAQLMAVSAWTLFGGELPASVWQC